MSDTPVVGPVDEEEFTLTLEMGSGESVIVNVRYPKERGLVAVQALARLSTDEMSSGLLSMLRNDPSVAAWLEEHHLGFDDEEDSL